MSECPLGCSCLRHSQVSCSAGREGLGPFPILHVPPLPQPAQPTMGHSTSTKRRKNLVADVVLDADGDAVEQPFLLVPFYFLQLLLALQDKVSQAVCLLGHFQGLCWTCGRTGVR